MLSPIESAQPRQVGWLVIGSPIICLSVFAFLEWDSLARTRAITKETLGLWVVLSVILAVLLIPLWKVPRSVTVDGTGATVRYFTGRRRMVAWSDIADIALLGAAGGPLGSTELLRIKPQNGQIVQVTDRMSNFEQSKSFACKSWPGSVRCQPSTFERVLLNAKRSHPDL